MSRRWEPARGGSRHICRHKRCERLDSLATIFLALAYLAIPLGIDQPPRAVLWIVLGTACCTAGLVLRHWPHPRAGDPGIEAIIDATRESRFISHRPHFEQWQDELRIRRTEADDINTLLIWAMEAPRIRPQLVVSDSEATNAARRLAARARRKHPGGLLPEEVTLSRGDLPWR